MLHARGLIFALIAAIANFYQDAHRPSCADGCLYPLVMALGCRPDVLMKLSISSSRRVVCVKSVSFAKLTDLTHTTRRLDEMLSFMSTSGLQPKAITKGYKQPSAHEGL